MGGGMGFFFLTLSILFNITANGFFKTASLRGPGTDKWMLFGVGLFIGLLNTLAYLKALESMKLGIAYAVFAAASTIGIAVVSVVLFQESLSPQKILALGVISAGLLLLWKA
jgi:multidrug transporter EmrE-like cation transporter